MANIQVTCPTCGKMLEVGAEHEGQEVECGECFQVFVARGPDSGRTSSTSSSRPPSGRKSPAKRRNDDDDDYEHDHRREQYDDYDYEPRSRRGSSGGGGAGGSGAAAVAGLIIGVIALLTSCCPFTGVGFGVLAMVLGSIGKKSPGSSGTGTAAVVLGTIAFLISAGLLVFWFAAGGKRFGN